MQFVKLSELPHNWVMLLHSLIVITAFRYSLVLRGLRYSLPITPMSFCGDTVLHGIGIPPMSMLPASTPVAFILSAIRPSKDAKAMLLILFILATERTPILPHIS